MEITFDSAKNAINFEKHGISLADAVQIDWDTAFVTLDNRRDYGEQREVAIAYLGTRLYVVVYMDRENARRIISLRKANKREIQHYAQT
ncbi:BrnT family toxin [Herbaspirillum chlorophenolicum]|uniref:BrnT family toxin n=1 Tax=Herbaspirillum chlorophenolicum TaxID=211589 RepID=A0ABW8EVW4_9BURK